LPIKSLEKPFQIVEQNIQQAPEFAERGYVLETGKTRIDGKEKELLGNELVKKAYLGLKAMFMEDA